MIRCPDRDRLLEILEGTPAPDDEGGRAHVATCIACQATLDELSDDAEVRNWADASSPWRGETKLGQLVEVLCGSKGQTPFSDRARTLLGLGPPRHDGELGTLGPLRVQAEVGRGGMGIVFRGYDEALARPVAVKVLRPELMGEGTAARMLHEAQAAARFRHDHAVTVHAVATTPAALPYIVMEYLDGQTLAQRLRSDPPLPIRSAVELLAQVADALAAAHAAGLIHRDVKPSNILLEARPGAAVRAKIVDFGLARMAEGPTNLTQTGHLAGTPAFMSPEQADDPGTVNALSDVYNLGATLYQVLTGEPPFRGTQAAVLRQVVEDEPRPPRLLNDAVPRDLETVCLKAMAKEPHRRYSSAAALAEELRRFLRGESITARPVGRMEKTWRWCRRNPGIATLSAALVLILLAGLAGTSWQAWRASDNATRADSDRRLAEERRDDAEKSELAALGAVDSFFTRVSEERLLREPKLDPLRRKLLEQALAHYRQFLTSHADNPRVEREAALAAFRVARIVADIGSRDEAIAAYREAIARLETVVGRDDANRDLKITLANSHMSLGIAQQQRGNLPEAMASLQSAAALCRMLLDEEPSNFNLRSNLLVCYGNLANWHTAKLEYREALAWYEKTQAELESLVQAEPNNAGLQRTLGLNTHNMAMGRYSLGEPISALAGYERAHGIRRRLVGRFPDNVLYQRDLARTEAMLAAVSATLDRRAPALEHYQAAVVLLEKLVEHSPAVLEYRRNLGQVYLNLAACLAEQDEAAQALAVYEKGRIQNRAVLKADPASAYARDELVLNLRETARVHLSRKQPQAALSLLEEAVALILDCAKRSPDQAQVLFKAACKLAPLAQQLPVGPVHDRGVEQIVRLLQQAITLDPTLRSTLATHAELAPLRGEGSFKTLAVP